MIENEFERITDRADEFEQKCSQFEIGIKGDTERLRQMEEIAGKNSDAEDKYEKEIKELTDRLKDSETQAEFGEKTVEKLESTIDKLEGLLFEEKSNYQELSIKLDQTLNDMMAILHC